MVLPDHREDVRVGEAWVCSLSQSQRFPPQYVVTSGDLVVVGEVSQSVLQSLSVNRTLCHLILTEGPVFLPDEDGARVAGLTHCGPFSLVTLTVSRGINIVAAGNTDTAKVPLRVDTFSVSLRTDGGVLALVNVPAGQVVLGQPVAGVTADEAARGVEAVLALLTVGAPAWLTLVCVSAGLSILPQVVAGRTTPPAPHRVETNLVTPAVVDIRAALVDIPALLAVSQVLVARLAGWNTSNIREYFTRNSFDNSRINTLTWTSGDFFTLLSSEVEQV